MSAGETLALAAEYLAAVDRQRVDQLPASVLVRECAELRHQLRLVLKAAAETALTGQQGATIASAAGVAIDALQERVAFCLECQHSPAGLCEDCDNRLIRIDEYRVLERELGGAR